MCKLANVLRATLVCMTVWAATTAGAATIDVTITSDTVADDGLCSLREAVSAANTGIASGKRPGECVAGSSLPVVDLIQIRPGTFRLSRGGPSEDGNAGGDLDITESVVIQGAGRARTTVRNGIGDPTVKGDGDRLFHADPAGSGGVDLTLHGLTVADGDVGCTGDGCTTGASAVEAAGDGALTLANCRVLKNRSFCSGTGCGDEHAAAIRAVGGGALTIRRSLVKRNRAACEGDGCFAGSSAIQMWDTETSAGDFVLESSAVKANSSTCEGARCEASATIDVNDARELTVRATKISGNTRACTGTRCWAGETAFFGADGQATIERTDLRENAVSCGDEECSIGGALYVRADAVEMRSFVADQNSSQCDGLSCGVAEHVDIQAEDGGIVAEGLQVTGSETSCAGDQCNVNDVVRLYTQNGDVTLADATISDSTGACVGVSCQTGYLLLVDAESIAVVRSQLDANELRCSGQGCETNTIIDLFGEPGPVVVQDVSIANNTNVCFGSDCGIESIAAMYSQASNVTLQRVDVSNNLDSCGAGDGCYAGGGLEVFARLGVGAQELSLTENQVSCSGLKCEIEPVARLAGDVSGVAADPLAVDSNVVLCEGQECVGAEVVSFDYGAGSTIKNGRFTSNRSECGGAFCVAGFGGALRNGVRPLTIIDTTFSRNVTDGWGAAVYNNASAELVLDRVVMTENHANSDGPMPFGGYGGAIFNDAATNQIGVLRAFNSEIRGNLAGRTGGGIYNMGAIASFGGSTLTGNQPNNCLTNGGTGCP